MIFKKSRSHHRPIPEIPTPKILKILAFEKLQKISSVWTLHQKTQNVEKETIFPEYPDSTTLIIILLMMHYSSYVLYDMKKNKKREKVIYM